MCFDIPSKKLLYNHSQELLTFLLQFLLLLKNLPRLTPPENQSGNLLSNKNSITRHITICVFSRSTKCIIRAKSDLKHTIHQFIFGMVTNRQNVRYIVNPAADTLNKLKTLCITSHVDCVGGI